jgi:diguanylate cyclase (GGDEF)-like protein
VTDSHTSADPSLLQSLKHHLEGLKRTEHGLILYNQIQRGLQRYGDETGRIELVFVTFLHALLGKYAKSTTCDAATRIKARLIQQRLTLYLPTKPVTPAGSATPAGKTPEPAESASRPLPAAEAKLISPKITPTPEIKSTPPATEAKMAPPKEALLPTRQEKIEKLEDTLAEKVTKSITIDKKFGELLESERQALESPENPLGDFNDLKKILVNGLNELIEERQALIEKLSSASEYMKSVESDRERLRLELNQARKHSMTDELTGLPKRDVFVRQLESEIGRVKRYGFALALAVIDVDNLESVNRRHGRAAGDAVLRCYAGEILAKFRTYDLVARYGGDEFAVLFPNTQKNGAMHALEKARKSAGATFVQHQGRNIPLPSFSSVLTQYSPGEPVSTLLQRADETLNQAKLGGFNRMVVALPTS